MIIILKCLLIFIQFNLIKCLNSSSLTFVIDNSFSMLSEFEQVKNNTNAIMDVVLNEKSIEVKDIILFNFNDIEINLTIKTGSPREFKNALSSLESRDLFNYYDCVTRLLTAVKLSLQESLPGSHIYVFSGCKAAKMRYSGVKYMKILCEKIQSQVVFILTGDSQQFEGTSYKVYYEIATASSGYVFQIEENDFDYVLKTIRETTKGKQRLLTKKILQRNSDSEIPFTVENNMEYVIIYASGTYVRLDIAGPSKNKKIIMWTTTTKMLKISDLAPGEYTAWISGASTTYVTVTALVVLKKPEITINEGAKIFVKYGSSLSVTCTVTANPEPNIDWKDDIGDVIPASPINCVADFKYSKTLTISNAIKSKKYYCTSQNKQGQVMDTVEVTVLSPFKVNSYPGEIINGVYGNPTKIKCDITSHLPLIITWSHTNDRTNLKETVRASNNYTISWDQTELTINAMNFDSVGEYTCRASLPFNDEKFKEFTTKVKLENLIPPTIIDKNVTKIQVEENSPALIQCKVADISLKPTIRWEFKARNGHEFLSIPQFVEEMSIPSAVMRNTGYYRCIAENIMGIDDKVTELVVTKMPVAIILEGMNTSVLYGTELVINCRILAYPVPKVTWADSSGKLIYSEVLITNNEYEYTSVLKVPNVKKPGKYFCSAENIQGKTSANIGVTVSSPFNVMEYPEPITNSAYNKPITIKCDIRSHIPITISWYRLNEKTRAKEIIRPSDKYSISWDERRLMINHVDLDLLGSYSCKASLLFDKDEFIEFNTDVKAKGLLYPKIDKNVTTVEVQENTSASINCLILHATPYPKITWEFKCRGSNKYLIVPGMGETIEIPNAVMNNSGYYKCIAKNVAGSDVKITELIVKKPPVVTISEGTKINSAYGKELLMTCKVIAYPKPTITWNDDKGTILPTETLPGNNTYEYTSLLRIPNFKKIIRFYCRAVNNIGEDEANIYVTVPTILSVDSEVTMNVEYGKPATIKCGVKSQMPIVITWNHVNAITKETEIVRASKEYFLPWDSTKLIIRSMDYNLVGKYSCKASLLFDPEQYAIHDTNVNINRLIPPKLNKTYSVIEINENKPATIECKVLEGTPIPKLSWQFKSRESREFLPIPGFAEYLRIPSAVLQSAGNYRCIAENSAGRDDKTTELIVVKKPLVMIVEGSKLTLSYGANLTLACKVTAYPVPTITWSSDNDPIIPFETLPDSSEFQYISRLRIISVKKSYNFSCKAENNQGIVTESIEVVTEPPFQVLEYPKEWVSVEYGKEYKIRCIILSKLSMQMQWFHTIDKSNTIQISQSSNKYNLSIDHNELTIKQMDSDVVGKYTCKASLLIDAAVFREFDSNLVLGDLVAPLIQKAPALTKVKVNTNVIILCRILKGNPKPTIKWYFKRRQSDTFVPIEKSGEELYIPAITPTQSGHYKCIGVNKIGSHEMITELFVEVAESGHTADDHNLNILIGETRKIKCLVTHTRTDFIKWYMNGIDTMVNDTYLTLDDVDISMDGNYTCQVTNNLGSHSYTYIVDVGYLPVFINDLDTTNIDWKGSEDLDCKAKAKPEAKAIWTYNGVPVDVSTDTLDLKISGLGQYICNISNVHGSITRIFNVTSNGCLINRNAEATPYTPLLLNNSSILPLFETVNEYLVIKPGTRFKLSCHNRNQILNYFEKFPKEIELEVTCNHEDKFWVYNKLYEYSDFHCNEKVLPVVIKTKKECLGNNSELIRVGFNASEFIEIYQVCLDTVKLMPLYTHVVMRQKNSKIDTKAFQWFRDTQIGYRKMNLEYTCENVLSSMCYARTQLVSVHDVPFGPAQTSTFIDHLNNIPVWKPDDDTDRMTWQAVEDNVRLLVNVNNVISVWSGASVFINTGGGSIPRFLWKILMFEESDITVVIYVNDPAPTDADIRCESTCDGSSPSWIQSTDVFTYCCNFEEFLNAFKLPETILVDPTLPPDINRRMLELK